VSLLGGLRPPVGSAGVAPRFLQMAVELTACAGSGDDVRRAEVRDFADHVVGPPVDVFWSGAWPYPSMLIPISGRPGTDPSADSMSDLTHS